MLVVKVHKEKQFPPIARVCKSKMTAFSEVVCDRKMAVKTFIKPPAVTLKTCWICFGFNRFGMDGC
jgi:hypothetical protein